MGKSSRRRKKRKKSKLRKTEKHIELRPVSVAKKRRKGADESEEGTPEASQEAMIAEEQPHS